MVISREEIVDNCGLRWDRVVYNVLVVGDSGIVSGMYVLGFQVCS